LDDNLFDSNRAESKRVKLEQCAVKTSVIAKEVMGRWGYTRDVVTL
jgi:hypothetical protein